MDRTPRYWQWPNVLAIDAALIAVIWQISLANTLSIPPVGLAAHIVLGLSVWLTYSADRLFDVASRADSALLSARHRFSKRNARRLWRVWFVLLAADLLLATQLTSGQLKQGAFLLSVCLIYTLLNQKLSRRFFPKEICVALIYAGGVVVFLPEVLKIDFFIAFTGLCLLNCLIIGAKEREIDAEMHVHSIALKIADRWLMPTAWIAAGAVLWSGVELSYAMALSFGLLGALQSLRNRVDVETFRVLADAALLFAPIMVWLRDLAI